MYLPQKALYKVTISTGPKNKITHFSINNCINHMYILIPNPE